MRAVDPAAVVAEVERLRSEMVLLQQELVVMRQRNSDLNRRLDELFLTHDRVDELERMLVEESEAGRRLNTALGWVVANAGEDLLSRPEWTVVAEAMRRWADLHDREF